MSKLITFDERGRAPLKQYGGRPGGDYLVEELPGGALILTPAVIMTEAEASMWRSKPSVAAHLATEPDDSDFTEIDLDTGEAVR